MAKILLIEDDPTLRNTLRDTLVRLGHSVVAAENGKIAMVEFTKNPPDLVLTDLVMPEQEGLETIALLRKQSQVPIIAMSGGLEHFSAPAALSIASNFGADAVLTKPFEAADLKAALVQFLGRDAG